MVDTSYPAVEPISDASFVTLEAARAYLDRETNQDFDAIISACVNGAAGRLERYTGRRLKSRAYAAATALVVDGEGRNELTLPEYPLTAIAEIRERYIDGTSRKVIITNARFSEAGLLWLPNDYFGRGFRNIEIDCTAGYDQTLHPEAWADLRKCALRIVQVDFQDRVNQVGRGASFSVGGESLAFIDRPLPQDVEQILRDYRRIL